MAITSKVKLTTGKLDPFARDLIRELSKRVLIGIPGDAARTPEPGEPSPPNNAVIGYLMETGALERNLPARPFLAPGVEPIRDKAVQRLVNGAKAAFQGDLSAPEKALVAIGEEGVAAVRGKIVDGPFVPLSERTLEARKARGVTRESPLVDTGQLRNAVKAIVTSGNGEGR